MDSVLSKLNAEQRESVEHFGSPLLILAGAGSGKTRVVTTKISYLIDHHSIPAAAITAVTFTNKAATEMRQRAEQLNDKASSATICTFHSFGARLLRTYGEADGLSRNFNIYDTNDSLSLMKSLFPDDTRVHLEQMMRHIEKAKHHGLSPDDDLSSLSISAEFVDYYRAYQQKLGDMGNVDFGDLILRPLRILKQNIAVRESNQNKIQVLLIDEYQDTNIAQYKLIQQLYHTGMYLCAVGDDDQSIYSFRGSDVTHIVNFPRHFSNTDVMYLLRNYRSTQAILALASQVIANNHARHEKVLYSKYTGGEKPKIVYLHDNYQEANFVVSDIVAHHDDGEIAIMYRTNAQSRTFESELNRAEIPYRVVGGVRFYEREEVKDLLAYLKCIANPQDEIAFRRILNKPARGIGPVAIHKIIETAATHNGNIILALENMGHTNSAVRAGCKTVAAVVRNGQRAIAAGDGDASAELLSIGDVLQRIAEDSKLEEHYRNMDEDTGTFKSDNISELLASAQYYPSTLAGLTEFLERAGIQGESGGDSTNARITLITMHNTKGLEFDTVYIVGLQDGLFPRTTDLDVEKMEEERRLFYVAITRAKRRLTLTSFQVRHWYGKTTSRPASRLLSEISADLVHRDMRTERQPRQTAPRRQRTPGVARSSDYGAASDDRSRFTVGTASDDQSRFTVGTAVFHNDYGAGEILSKKKDGKQHILGVRFQNGKVAHFIEKYAALEKIALD